MGLLAFYGIVAALLAPPLLPYLGVSALAYAFILLLNKWRLQALARFLMSIAPMYVVAMLHALILSVDDSMMVSIYVFQACTMILPWVLIDYENWLPFTFASIIALIPLFAFPSFNAFFEKIIEIAPEIGNSIKTPSKLETIVKTEPKLSANVLHGTRMIQDESGTKLFSFKVDHKGTPSIVFQKELLHLLDFDLICDELRNLVKVQMKSGRPDLVNE